jgi:hypothetical protein
VFAPQRHRIFKCTTLKTDYKLSQYQNGGTLINRYGMACMLLSFLCINQFSTYSNITDAPMNTTYSYKSSTVAPFENELAYSIKSSSCSVNLSRICCMSFSASDSLSLVRGTSNNSYHLSVTSQIHFHLLEVHHHSSRWCFLEFHPRDRFAWLDVTRERHKRSKKYIGRRKKL